MGKNTRYFSTEDAEDGGNVTAQDKKAKTSFIKGGKIVRHSQSKSREGENLSTTASGEVIKPSFKTIKARTNFARPYGKAKNKKWDANRRKKKNLGPDPFPDKPIIPKEKLDKYSRGAGLNLPPLQKSESEKSATEVDPTAKRQSGVKVIRTNIHQEKLQRKDEKIKLGLELAARAEILLLEDPGGIEVDEDESTLQLKQLDISQQVDLASASKIFNLTLETFAPYKIDYTLNGRHLLIGGEGGHVATFDWVTKKLHCEFNVMEKVHDVKWLHNELLFAVAQKNWTYVYDSQGIEIHCLKKMDNVLALDFLPYHFLLVGGHDSGFLSWVDVSIGKIVAQFGARHGPISLLKSNPANAVVHCAHPNGTVTLWTPTVKKPVASVLCHGSPISSLAIDSVGKLMATGGYDGTLRLWDLRNSFTPLTSVKFGVVTQATFSQRGLLACGHFDQTLVFSEIAHRQKPYLKHVSSGKVASLQFCPFEDVLGVGTSRGFESIIIPGAGEPNFDALERNPYQTKAQRREAEVKSLLEKIQPELITLDNNLLGEVDVEKLVDNMEHKPQHYKKSDIEIAHRKRRKSAKIPRIKEQLLDQKLRKLREDQAQKTQKRNVKKPPPKYSEPLDRFASTKKSK